MSGVIGAVEVRLDVAAPLWAVVTVATTVRMAHAAAAKESATGLTTDGAAQQPNGRADDQ